jgi:hypothetical protein
MMANIGIVEYNFLEQAYIELNSVTRTEKISAIIIISTALTDGI